MNIKLTAFFIFLSIVFSVGIHADENLNEENSTSASAWFNKGYELQDKGEVCEAIECFRKAKDLNPRNISAYLNLGVCIIRCSENKYDTKAIFEGLNYVRQAERMNPNDFLTQHNLAVVKYHYAKATQDMKLYKEALDSFGMIERKFEIEKDYFYDNWAIILTDLSSIEGTLTENKEQIFRKIFKANKMNPRGTWYTAVRYYSLNGEKEKALLWLEEAMIKKPITEEALSKTDFLDNIRDVEQYKKLVAKYCIKADENDSILSEQSTIAESNVAESISDDFDSAPYYEEQESEDLDYLIRSTINFPEEVEKYGALVNVEVSFTVDRDGSIKNPQICSSTFYTPQLLEPYKQEVLRLMELMPAWIPAEKDGKPVPATQSLLIQFGYSD